MKCSPLKTRHLQYCTEFSKNNLVSDSLTRNANKFYPELFALHYILVVFLSLFLFGPVNSSNCFGIVVVMLNFYFKEKDREEEENFLIWLRLSLPIMDL